MRKSVALAIALVSAAVVGCAMLPSERADAREAYEALQDRVIAVGTEVTPSVVHIEAVVRVNNRRNVVSGSGFITDAHGTVLTNEHVVERAQKVSVIVPGRAGRYAAEVVGTDKLTDLAVLRIEPREGEAPFVASKLGDSDKIRVGEWVIAIGNPYGLDGTVSLGIVSAKGRDLKAVNLLNDFIQTDAMIDRGSSGGPLVNLRGEVVGINSRGQGRGIGFTIPINTAKQVADDLLGEGRIARSFLGVSIQPLKRELAEYWDLASLNGVVVNGVIEESPADEAGIEIGDILVAFDGEALLAEKEEDVGQFQRLVARTPIGKEIAIELVRDRTARTVHAKLMAQPKVVPDEEESDFGFIVQEITQGLHRSQRLPSRDGALVSFVERGSEADESGMSAGDLIQSVGEQSVRDLEEFRTAMREVSGDRPFLIRALRGSDTQFLLIVPRGHEDATHASSSEPPARAGAGTGAGAGADGG